MDIDCLEKQQQIVCLLSKDVFGDWERIVVSYEQEEKDQSIRENTIYFSIIKTPVGMEVVDIERFPEAAKGALRELNNMMQQISQEKWSCCNISVDNSGKFEIEFKYGEPKRINGIFDDESYAQYNDYIERYMKQPVIEG